MRGKADKERVHPARPLAGDAHAGPKHETQRDIVMVLVPISACFIS